MSDESDDPHFELVMPFVVVTSKGGLYDDEAYVAGFEIGRMDAHLSVAAALGIDTRPTYIWRDNLRQADLVAMKHGFKLIEHEMWDNQEWASISFELEGE